MQLGGIGVDDVTMTFCGDAADVSSADPSLAYLDYVACDVANEGPVTVSISLGMAGIPSGDNQFRVHLDLDNDGKDDETLKYNTSNGSVTGLKSLVVEPDPLNEQVLIFTFDLPKKGWNGESFQWYAETQDGVSGGAGQGFVDRMPDAGYFTHTMKQ